MGATENDLENWIRDVMEKKGIYKYTIDLSGSTSKGDGYLGLVTFVRVRTSNGSSEHEVYDLVVKSAKKGEELRKQTPIRKFYFREMFMYTKVFPLFVEFQKENSVESCFRNGAECYGICDKDGKEALILQNLKSKGFEIHNRTQAQNLNHALFVFRNYGRWHALSLGMKIKKTSVFKALTKNMHDDFAEFIIKANLTQQCQKDFDTALGVMKKYTDNSNIEKFEQIKNDIGEIFTNLAKSTNPAAVILHGDCWNNNMMFKYEGQNKIQPVDMRFIDFQLSKLASPIFDLSYYLYTCTDRNVLQNFDFLLQVYYSSLSDFLEEFDVCAESVLTFKQFKEQWKIYGRFGLVMCPMIVKMELCEAGEVIDLTEAAEEGKLENMLDFKIKNHEIYEERLKDVFEHWATVFF